MRETASLNPYEGNILIAPLGPILSPQSVLSQLTMLPPLPPDLSITPKHVRLHHLMGLRDFHLPSKSGFALQQTIDLMIRSGYRYRDPKEPSTWRALYSEPELAPLETRDLSKNPALPKPRHAPRMPAMAAAGEGVAGSGKTEAVLRALNFCYPSQVIVHPSFPRLQGQHVQVVWQSVDIPGSGRTSDLAEALMRMWDETLSRHVQNYRNRFDHTLQRQSRDGAKMLSEWRQVASAGFLGFLHLDEIQNLFKIGSLDKRRIAKKGAGEYDLSIVEDQSLKWLLTLTNTWQIPILVTGTPDGIGALTARMATLQRISASGYHRFDTFPSASDGTYVRFMETLGRYQYTNTHLEISSILELMFELTGGIPRLMVAFWIAAHRIALNRRNDDELKADDFRTAARTSLAPIAPSVKAFISRQPDAMRRYEDLNPGPHFWEGFWAPVDDPRTLTASP